MARLFACLKLEQKLFCRCSSTSINVHEHKLTRPKKRRSLIPKTLQEMEKDEEFNRISQELKESGQTELLRRERVRVRRALNSLGIPDFSDFVGPTALRRRKTEILGVNIGLFCNQACSHCHVESSPKKIKEVMSEETVRRIIDLVAASSSLQGVDITGGAPELCPQFRPLIEGLRKVKPASKLEIIDRCNLTALLEPGQEDTVDFLAQHTIRIVASLPCYSAKNVNLQRGSQVFQKSIQAIKELNAKGFGMPNSNLRLDFVYNPLGAFLPPEQKPLQDKYRVELRDAFGIEFTELFVLTNLPIKRFADFLHRRNETKSYLETLVNNFNPKTLNSLMCKNVLSLDYEGRIFNCDFNAQLDMQLKTRDGKFILIAQPTMYYCIVNC